MSESTRLDAFPLFVRKQTQKIPAKITALSVDRRQFLKISGVSVGSGFILAACSEQTAEMQSAPVSCASQHDLNVFISIDCDDTVTLTLHRSEMGQGIRTGLAQVLADELDAEWSKLKFEQALGDEKYGSQNTDGSRSIRHDYARLRKLAATARTMLEHAAAQVWETDLSNVEAKAHAVHHKLNNRRLSYGALAELAAGQSIPDDSAIKLKAHTDFNYIGKAIDLIDIDALTSGSAVFGYDVQVPDMLYASIERCPVLGGKLKRCHEDEARKVPGVVDIITLPQNTVPVLFQAWHGVVVIATNTWAATQGREKLTCDWDLGKNAEHNSQAYFEMLKSRVNEDCEPTNSLGDVEAAFDNAASTHEAVYQVPYQPHAPMEVPAAVADVSDSGCEIWSCTQAPQGARDHVAQALGMAKENIKVNVTFLGGAFGRKSKHDFCVEAALISKAVGKPVKVCWTREDDIRFDYYHAMSAQYFKASFDKDAQVTGWLQRTAFPSIVSIFAPEYGNTNPEWELDLGFDELPVAVKNIRHEKGKSEAHVRIGWLRSVANIHHAFARSSFIDELAHKARQHPLSFFEQIMGPDRIFEPKNENWNYSNYGETTESNPISTARLKAVARTVVEKSDFTQNAAENSGWGLAASRSFLAYVAIASKVSVVDEHLTIEEVHCAIDCGLAVNPDRVRSQMEGAVIFGMSIALMGEISVRDGQVEQSNFDDFLLARMRQSPKKIVVHIIDSKEVPAGVGEPGLPPVAPSIANAIFAATGNRIRELPINKVYSV